MRAIIYPLFFIILISYSFAVPGIPCDFYGSVTINNEEAPRGSVIEAYIDGVRYGSFTVKTPGKYGLLSVRGDDTETAEKDGGVEGDTVTFRVNGKSVSQTGKWEMGKSVRVDLKLKTTAKEGVSSSNAETSERETENNITEGSTDKTKNEINKNFNRTANSEGIEKERKAGNNSMNQGASMKQSGEQDNTDKNETNKKTNNLWIYALTVLLLIIIYLIIKKRGFKMKKEMIIFLLIPLTVFLSTGVLAIPGTPADFYGTLKIDGYPVREGAVVISYCTGVHNDYDNYANYTVKDAGLYGFLTIPGDDTDTAEVDGCEAGDNVTFQVKINNVYLNASESALFNASQTINLNLTVSDGNPPTAPQNLNAVEVQPGNISLQWNASTDDISVAFYNVYRDISLLFANPVLIGQTNLTHFADIVVPNGTKYFYVVRAHDTHSESSNSNIANVTVTDLQPPSAPTGLRVVDVPHAEQSLFVSWNKNPESDVGNYTLYVSTDGTSFSIRAVLSQTNFTDTNVIDGATYYYKVMARDISGNPSPNSSVEANESIDDLPPDKISGVSAVDTADAENSINLTWNPATGDATGYLRYNIYRNGTLIANQSIGVTHYIDTNVLDGHSYSYRVSAVDDADNEGELSDAVNVVPLDDVRPLAPSLVLVSAGNGIIKIDWNAVADAELYRVYMSNQSNGYSGVFAITTDTNYTVTGLNPNVTYYFKVDAVDNDSGVKDGYNVSDRSNEVSGKPANKPSINALTESGSFIQSGLKLNFTLSSGVNLDALRYNVTLGGALIEGSSLSLNTNLYSFFINTTLWEGNETYVVNIWVNDSLSQYEEKEFTYTVDNDKPAVVLITQNNKITNDNTPDFEFRASDNLASVLSCRIYITNGTWSAYVGTNSSVLNNTNTTITASQLEDGHYNWSVDCTDLAGNSNGVAVMRRVIIDTVNPVTSSNTPAGWQNKAFNITLTANDENGIAYTNYSLDGAMHTGNTVQITTPGNHTVVFFSVDLAGNIETQKTIQALLDLEAPNTTTNLTEEWQNTDFNITLNASDSLSGVALTNYSIDGVMHSGNLIEINTEGNHTVVFFSIDNAGNIEAQKTIHALLDKTAPDISSVEVEKIYAKTGDEVIVNATVSDSLSGIMSCNAYLSFDTQYSMEDVLIGNLTKECYGNITIPSKEDGTYYVIVRAVDNAGNYNLSNHVVHIDNTAPAITLYSPENTTYNSENVVLNWSISDASSGVNKIWYIIDGVKHFLSGSVNSSVMQHLSAGHHELRFYSTDSVNNERHLSREIIVNVPLNASKELNEIKQKLGSPVKDVSLYYNGSDESNNESLNINKTLSLKMSLNVSGINATVEIPAFNGLDAYWDNEFAVDVSTSGNIAGNIEDTGVDVKHIVVFVNSTNFLPESAFTQGARITIDSPLGNYDVLYVEDEDGKKVYKLDRCTTIPSLINLTTMCFVNTSTNVTVYVPHLSGTALVNDTSAPVINITSPGTAVNDSFFTFSFNVTEPNPKDNFCVVRIYNGSLINTTSVGKDDIDWDGVSGVYSMVYRDITNGNYNITVNCTDDKNQSSMKTLSFSVNDTTAPEITEIESTQSGSSTVTLKITLTTNEDATCRYSSSDKAYDEMTAMSSSGKTHSVSISFTSDSSGKYYFRCMDEAGNTMLYSNYTSYSVDVAEANKVQVMAYQWLDNAHNFTLSQGMGIFFKINGESHHVKVLSIGNKQVKFEMFSEPVQFTIKEGSSKELDVDRDGKKDIKISVFAVYGSGVAGRTYIGFSKIKEVQQEQPVNQIKEQPKEQQPVNKTQEQPRPAQHEARTNATARELPPEKKPLNKNMLISIGVIVIALLGFGVFLFWRNRE